VDREVYCKSGNGSHCIRILSNGGRDTEMGDDVFEICFEDLR
jgi:hypothetical protein